MERLSSLLLVLILVSCTSDDVPEGLYAYQVSRLLTHDSSKVWQLSGLSEGRCNSAYYYQFDSDDDSLEFRQIRWNCSTNMFSDTVYIAKGLPSSIGLLFSDTIHWDDESFWLIPVITESNLSIIPNDSFAKIELFY